MNGEIVRKFAKSVHDTGSAAVQVCFLTEKINLLSTHLVSNKKDHSSRRGLLMLIGKRKRLLAYLEKHNINQYYSVKETLSIRK